MRSSPRPGQRASSGTTPAVGSSASRSAASYAARSSWSSVTASSGCFLSQRASRLANSSWRWPESRRTSSASSHVPWVAMIGPLKPSSTTWGISPQWSRWACVRRIASSVFGSNPSGILLRTASLGLPWNIPQSMRILACSVTSRN